MDDMPDIDFVTTDVPASELITEEAEPIDGSMVKALMVRQFAHDITTCDETKQLLTALGLTHGDDEGYERDHLASHRRVSTVYPLENLMRFYAEILGPVVATALVEGNGIAKDISDEHSVVLAQQNAMVVLASSRAIIAQLISKGVLCYGPMAIHLIQQGGIGE